MKKEESKRKKGFPFTPSDSHIQDFTGEQQQQQ